MDQWNNMLYISIYTSAIVISILGIWLTCIMPGIEPWSRYFFITFFIVFMLCAIVCIPEIVISMYPDHPANNPGTLYILLFTESIFISLPLPMLTVYILHSCGEDIYRSSLLRAVLVLLAVYYILLACTRFIRGFALIVDVNRYYRGQLYPLLLLPMVAILVLSLAGTVKRRRKLSPKVFLSFIIVFASMTIALVIQMFIDVFLLIDITFVFAAMVMYGLIISSQIGQNLLQQQEIAHQRASIMVLQMRPHFIYNTLTSIYSLCNQEPQKARKVILDFTNYLRKNFNAISSESTIPFTEELEHIRAYLSVEQALYEDSLTVDYDIQHTMFRVPPLTLQPIVENAVKHGRDPYAGPLHIIIETRKTDSGSVVTVMNDGRGFTAYDDSEPHIALKNVQQRLKLMCGGSLDIRQGDEGGAVVTVYVADKM